MNCIQTKNGEMPNRNFLSDEKEELGSAELARYFLKSQYWKSSLNHDLVFKFWMGAKAIVG